MNFKGKRFLVIGGAGFIGSATVEKLTKTSAKEIIIYDNFVRGKIKNLEKSLLDKRVKIYSKKSDILNTFQLNKAMKNIDGVFHFAALWLLECHEYPKKAFEVNVKGTLNVMEACIKNNVKKLVYSSSASVYGDSINNSPLKETSSFNNKNFYGSTKIACESMLVAYHFRYNLNFIGLRYMNVYGPGQDYKGAYIAVIMRMIDDIDKGIGPTIIGDGSESFDFVSVSDCAIANVKSMKSKLKNEFFNVCTGKKTSLKYLANLLLKLKNSDAKIKFKKNNNKTLVKNRIGDPSKAIKGINFKASMKLKTGLKNLIKWRNSIKI